MPRFMNAELEALRDNLECGHCGAKFKGSDSQAWKVKYERRTVYCSDVCRKRRQILQRYLLPIVRGKAV